MVGQTRTLELRRDAALHDCFQVDDVSFGFTTIQDKETSGYLSWVFIGEVDKETHKEETPYVIGRIFADKHSNELVIITWLPRFTTMFFTSTE